MKTKNTKNTKNTAKKVACLIKAMEGFKASDQSFIITFDEFERRIDKINGVKA